MGTFNAGAIEATLTLDRSRFKQELQAAREDVKKFEQGDGTKKIDIEANTAKAKASLDDIKARLDTIGDAKGNIDIDTSEAKAQIAIVKAQLNSIRKKSVTVDADVREAQARIDLFEAKLRAIPNKKTVKIDVEGGNGVSGTQLLVASILAALPLIPPLAAGATAAVGALGSSLLAAGGGAVILGAGLYGVFKRFQDLQKAGGPLAPQMQMMADAADALSKAWGKFLDAVQGPALTLMASGFNILAGIIPQLVPIFMAFAKVANDALTGLGNWFNGPEGQAVLKWFQTFGAQQFGVILGILGDLGRVILNITQAFTPFATQFMNGFKAMTASWVSWSAALASSNGFQQFIAFVQQTGPMVIATLASLWDAILNILVALAPLAPVVLGVVKAFADWVANMDPATLRIILEVIAAMVVAFTAYEAIMKVVMAAQIAWNAAQAIATAVQWLWNSSIIASTASMVTNAAIWVAVKGEMLAYAAVSAVVRAATLAWTAVQWLLNAALTANPIGLIIVGIAALVAGLILAWQHSETFRAVVIAVWNGIKVAVSAVVTWFVGTVVPAFQAAWAMVVAIWDASKATVIAIVAGLVAAVKVYFSIWSTIITTYINIWKTVITTAWNVIRTVVTAVVSVIVAVVKAQFAAMSAAISAVMSVIKAVISGALAVVKALFGTQFALIKALVTGDMNGVKAIVTNVINNIKSVVSSGLNAAKTVAVNAFNAMKSGITSALNGAKSAVSNAIGAIKGMFAGAGGWLVGAGRAIIDGLVSGIRSAIGAVQDILSSVTNLIPDWKGPASRDAELLRPNGRLVMHGFMNGIKDQIAPLQGLLGGVTDMVGGGSYGGSSVRLAGQGTMAVAAPTVNFYNYNPIAEASSETATRQMTELAVLGVFSGRG